MNQVPTVFKLLLVAGLLCIAACGSNEPKEDGVIDLTLNIKVSTDVNPDDSGRASPLFLQVFELRTTSAMNKADYLEVYRDPQLALGADLINATEIGPLFPGSEVKAQLRFAPASTAVGFLGEFNRYSEMQASQTLYLEPGKDREISLRIDIYGIHIE